ncbi:MAG TPA: putative zinc-binding metallopeptidase [Candidatus Methylacidiphilales bacterium]
MKTYTCTCGQLLFFENVSCTSCLREVGFLPDLICASSMDPANDGCYAPTALEAKGRIYKKCQNYSKAGVCNWMVPVENTKDSFCVSCRLDTMIPDQSVPQNVLLWALTEAAKRRLVYSSLRLKLPLANRDDDPKGGLGFRFLADTTNPDGTVSHVMTEHDHGLITLNIAEADDAAREKIRLGMKEPYRTLLGHFRHETGHYYWDRLVDNSKFLEPFRELFGDERQNYDEAMKKYYASGAPANWQDNFISVYATMHPWEDWAESWAHYLHIQDTLEVAADFGLVGKRIKIDPKGNAEGTQASIKAKPFDQVLDAWAELTVALNSINRSMGLRDLYPFILSKTVVDKLYFISEVIAGSEALTQKH